MADTERTPLQAAAQRVIDDWGSNLTEAVNALRVALYEEVSAADAVVLKMAPDDATNLRQIAAAIRDTLNDPAHVNGDGGKWVMFPRSEAHRLVGYCDQLDVLASAHADDLLTLATESAAAIADFFHSDRERYEEFYDDHAESLSGFPGIWKLCGDAGIAFARVEQERKISWSDNVSAEWIDTVQAYAAAVMRADHDYRGGREDDEYLLKLAREVIEVEIGVRPRPVAVAVVFDDAGRVCLLKRNSGPLAGTWVLPGGKCDPGEGVEHAAVRELSEETNLEGVAVGVSPRTVVTDFGKHLRTWVAVALVPAQQAGAPSVTEPDKFSEVGYFRVTDLPRPISPEDEAAIAYFTSPVEPGHPYAVVKDEEVSPERLASILLMTVSVEAPVAALANLTPRQRWQAANWATACSLDASDNFGVHVPKKPDFLSAFPETSLEEYLKP